MSCFKTSEAGEDRGWSLFSNEKHELKGFRTNGGGMAQRTIQGNSAGVQVKKNERAGRD